MKKLLSLLLVLAFCASAGAATISTKAQETLEQMLGPSDLIVRLTVNGQTTDSVSPSNQGRLIYDRTNQCFSISENGGAYNCILSSSGNTSLTVGANGQSLNIQSLTELTTIAAAATTDTTIQIPANAVVLAVSVRVTTVIPTAATFDIGVSGATTRYGTGISTAATTTNPGTNDATRFYGAAVSVRFTPDLTPAANTGRIRTTIHYLTISPPSN